MIRQEVSQSIDQVAYCGMNSGGGGFDKRLIQHVVENLRIKLALLGVGASSLRVRVARSPHGRGLETVFNLREEVTADRYAIMHRIQQEPTESRLLHDIWFLVRGNIKD